MPLGLLLLPFFMPAVERVGSKCVHRLKKGEWNCRDWEHHSKKAKKKAQQVRETGHNKYHGKREGRGAGGAGGPGMT